MPKKKVALVLSGGVSLGSYIAGALDELMKAFAASKDYEIDIITGASAGATTGAIIAHGLLYRGGETALHDVWVDKIDITDLLEPQVPAGEPASALSARHLEQVASETLQWDRPVQRAAFCASKLTLSMTIANTTGLRYVSRVEEPAPGRPEEYIQVRHSE